jgi:hypothetical protein
MYVIEATTEIEEVAQQMRAHADRMSFGYGPRGLGDWAQVNAHGWTLNDGRFVVLNEMELSLAYRMMRRLDVSPA